MNDDDNNEPDYLSMSDSELLALGIDVSQCRRMKHFACAILEYKRNRRIEQDLQTFPVWRSPPEYRWSVHSALHQRQLGNGIRFGSNAFTHGFIGSLQTVQRVELIAKLGLSERQVNDSDSLAAGRHIPRRYATGVIDSLSFNDSGSMVVSGGANGQVAIWKWSTESLLTNYDSGHEGNVFAYRDWMTDGLPNFESGDERNVFQVKFMPLSEDRHLVTSGGDGGVRIGDLASYDGHSHSVLSRQVVKHDAPCRRLSMDVNSPHMVLSCGEDGVVFEIDLRKAEANRILMAKSLMKRDKIPLYSINYHPLNSNLFCVAGGDSDVRVYDRRRMCDFSEFCGNNQHYITSYCPDHLVNSSSTAICAVAYNHNGKELVASYNDDVIYAFDAENTTSSDFSHRYRGHSNQRTVKTIGYFGQKSEFIISGSECGNIFIWDHDSEKIVQLKLGDHGVVNVVEVHPEMPVLASCGGDKDVKIWLPSKEKAGLKGDYVESTLYDNLEWRLLHS